MITRDPYYDTAQICVNGHVITATASRSPHRMQEFCDQCGGPAIVACPNCDRPIRGQDLKGGWVAVPYVAPSFCHGCGAPYPWTETKLRAAQEYADELDDLNEADKALLKRSLDEIARETPESPVAALRIKKLLVKMGPPAAGVMRDFVVDVASEAAKRLLFQ